MKLKALCFLAASSLASLFLSGCYIPQVPAGTVRITGGSGTSVQAASGVITGNLTETTIQSTVNLNLEGEKTKGFDEPTYGSVNIQDLGKGLTFQGTVVSVAPEGASNIPFPGAAAVCQGRAKYRDGNWFPVFFYIGLLQNPANEVPGQSHGDARHIIYVVGYGEQFSYYSEAAFLGGNFVFHGQNGVILR